MKLTVHPKVAEAFPELKALIHVIRGVKVERQNGELEKFKVEVFEAVRRRYSLEALKDLPSFRAYRDFFWRIGVDPTKHRPASEALIRRLLAGKPIPTINTLVDAYNLASIQSEVALAAFDLDRLRGDLTMRFAEPGEAFLGIGMSQPITLRGGEIVISDLEKLIAVYPHRDAENTKITLETRNVLLMTCGVPGLTMEKLNQAAQLALNLIGRFCGGQPEPA